jgi:hypothetical protein
VSVVGVSEDTRAIDTQTSLDGLEGGASNHPEGGVPMFVVKFQEPPVGVDGAVNEDWNINH